MAVTDKSPDVVLLFEDWWKWEFYGKNKKAKDLEACLKFENCKKHQKALQLGGHSKSQFS